MELDATLIDKRDVMTVTSFKCIFNKVSSKRLENMPGLVDSKFYFIPVKEKQIDSKTGYTVMVPVTQPAKVIRLSLSGYPSIFFEMIVWPLGKMARRRLCDDISTFQKEKNVYYTNMPVNMTGSPSPSATKEEQENFPDLYNKALADLKTGKKVLYSADGNAAKAIFGLKKLYGI